jgi:hypothetical protein
MHFGQFASKIMIEVHFPEVLDLSTYTTSGSLTAVTMSAISTPSPNVSFTSNAAGAAVSNCEIKCEFGNRQEATILIRIESDGSQRVIFLSRGSESHESKGQSGNFASSLSGFSMADKSQHQHAPTPSQREQRWFI